MSFLSHSAQDRAESRRRKTTRRVAKACDWCRSKKDRCDGARPTCATCKAAERCCTYNIETKKRGLPEGYVRALERLWGLATQLVPEIEDALLELMTSGTSVAKPCDLSQKWNSDSEPESFFSSWRRGRLYNELHRQLTTADGLMFDESSSPMQMDYASTQHAGAFGSNAALLAARSLKQLSTAKVDDPMKESIREEGAQTRLSQEHIQAKPGSGSESGMTISPTLATRLLQHYMKNTNTWLPMVDQADSMRLLYRHRNGYSLESGEQALFRAILLYSAIQTSTDGAPHGDTRFDLDSLHDQAHDSLPRSRSGAQISGTISHVKAMTVLTLVDIGRGYWEEAWTMIGQAIRLATFLKLHVPDTNLTEATTTRGPHTILTCFVLETLLSLHLHLPPHTHPETLASIKPIDCSGIDEWEQWSGASKILPGTAPYQGPSFSASTFNSLVEVAKLLQSAMSLSNSKDSSAQQLRHLLKRLNDRKDIVLEGVDQMNGVILPHHTLLQLTIEAGLSLLHGCLPAQSLPSREEEDSIRHTVLKLIRHQDSCFEPSTLCPGFVLLLGSLHHNKALVYETQAPIPIAAFMQSLSTIWAGSKELQRHIEDHLESHGEVPSISYSQGQFDSSPEQKHTPSVAEPIFHAGYPSTSRPEEVASPAMNMFTATIPSSGVLPGGSSASACIWPQKLAQAEYTTALHNGTDGGSAGIYGMLDAASASSLDDRDVDAVFQDLMAADADAWYVDTSKNNAPVHVLIPVLGHSPGVKVFSI